MSSVLISHLTSIIIHLVSTSNFIATMEILFTKVSISFTIRILIEYFEPHQGFYKRESWS